MHVFIIHGWTYSLDKWDRLIERLEGKGVHATVLKVPGLTEGSDDVWDINGYVDWLHEQIGNDDKPAIIGHSNGGRIALNYLVKYPDSLKHLFLIDSAGVYHNELPVKVKRGTFKTIAKAGKVVSKYDLPRKILYKSIGATDYYKASPNMRRTMQNMLESDKQLDVSKISVPTTLIWGKSDRVTPFRDAKTLKQQLQHATLEPIDGGGHSPHHSHAEQVAQIIAGTIKDME